MTPTPLTKRFRCRFCGALLRAVLPITGEPDGAMLLNHVAQAHPAELAPFLDQMRVSDDITPVILQVFEVVDEPRSVGHEGQQKETR